MCVKCVFFTCLFMFYSVLCDNRTYVGILSPECVSEYHRAMVSRQVPPRRYQYFHEVAQPSTLVDTDQDVDVRFRIIGGHKVGISAVPYQVLYGLYCGGALLAPRWVLTAAHCKEKERYVLAGSAQRSEAKRYEICAHYTHPRWNASALHSHDYDYQLVQLRAPVPVSRSARPIAIAGLDDARPGSLLAVSGWGHKQYKVNVMEDFVRRVYVPVMSREECTALPLTNYKTITPRMFCAGFMNGTKDSCQGDSGGPAVWRGRLVGLVSFGVGCAARAQPGVYAHVPSARGWIRQVTGLPL